MSLQRAGHSAVLNYDGSAALLIGGYGKPSPDAQSATSKRLLDPLQCTWINNNIPQPQTNNNIAPNTLNQNQQLNFHSTPTYTTAGKGYIHRPIPREHHNFHRVQNPQLPVFVYTYIQSILTQFSQYPTTSLPSDIQFSSPNTPTFSVLYGGRLSPTSLLDDLWIFCFELNIWLQILPPNIIQFDQQDGGALIPYCSMLCTLPTSYVAFEDEITKNVTIQAQENAHFLLTNDGQTVYQIEFTQTSNNIKPEFAIKRQLFPTDYPNYFTISGPAALSSPTSIVDLTQACTGGFSSLQPYFTQQQQQTNNNFNMMSVPKINIEGLPSILFADANLNEQQQQDATQNIHQQQDQINITGTINSELDAQQLWPIARYKAASISTGNKLYIHGGRSGFASNWKKRTKKDNTNSQLSTTQTQLIQGGATILIEATTAFELDPVSEQAAKRVQKNLDADNFVAIDEEMINNPYNDYIVQEAILPLSAIPPQTDKQLIINTNDPYFTSLCLNDMWVLDVSHYPYQWHRVDQLYTTSTNANNVMPSHRYGHSMAFVSTPNHGEYLTISGGLVIKPLDSHLSELRDVAISSHQQALIASSSLFFINITNIQNGQYVGVDSKKNNTQPDLNLMFNSYYYIPSLLPYALTTHNDATMNVEISLPGTLQIQNRNFDIYGHQLIGVEMYQKSDDVDGEVSNTIATLLSIGGTSHTCLAAASVMGLKLTTQFFEEMITNYSKLQNITTQLQWVPYCKPVQDALFIRHSATLLLQSSTIDQNQNNNTNNNNQQKRTILVLGGGALCFSFGAYNSLSFALTLTKCSTDNINQQEFNTEIKPLTLSTTQQTNTIIAPVVKTGGKAAKPKQQLRLQDNKKLYLAKNQENLTKGVEQKCSICNESFESKNKLFRHITITGHKLPTADNNIVTSTTQ